MSSPSLRNVFIIKEWKQLPTHTIPAGTKLFHGGFEGRKFNMSKPTFFTEYPETASFYANQQVEDGDDYREKETQVMHFTVVKSIPMLLLLTQRNFENVMDYVQSKFGVEFDLWGTGDELEKDIQSVMSSEMTKHFNGIYMPRNWSEQESDIFIFQPNKWIKREKETSDIESSFNMSYQQPYRDIHKRVEKMSKQGWRPKK